MNKYPIFIGTSSDYIENITFLRLTQYPESALYAPLEYCKRQRVNKKGEQVSYTAGRVLKDEMYERQLLYTCLREIDAISLTYLNNPYLIHSYYYKLKPSCKIFRQLYFNLKEVETQRMVWKYLQEHNYNFELFDEIINNVYRVGDLFQKETTDYFETSEIGSYYLQNNIVDAIIYPTVKKRFLYSVPFVLDDMNFCVALRKEFVDEYFELVCHVTGWIIVEGNGVQWEKENVIETNN